VVTNAPTYYQSISPSLTGDSLKQALDVLISSNVSVKYDWSRFLIVDQSLTDTNAVLTIYPNVNYPKANQVGGSQPPGYWNREHTYPQSKISGAATSDTHHIFADDHKTNSQRGNKPFGDVENSNANRVYDSLERLTPNYQTSSYFEPHDQAKGDVARATLYLNTLYGYAIENNFQSKELAILWAIQYPVTDWSRTRNNRIYTEQGNRNPYIDHPEWICEVYGQTSINTINACA
jgi:endonuclease I